MLIESLDSIADSINVAGKTDLFDIISLTISAASFIFAILVPVRISNRQDKIALFEKRLNAYLELMKIVQFSDWLENIYAEATQVIEEFAFSEKGNCVVGQFCQAFNCDISADYSDDMFNKYIVPTIERNKIVVDTIPFLYGRQLKSNRMQVEEELNNSYMYLNEFMKGICIGYDVEKSKNDLIKTVREFIQKHKDTLTTPLKM